MQSPKAEDQSESVQQASYSPGHAGPPPANQRPESAPHRPIRGQGQDLSLWPLASQPFGGREAGEDPETLISPPSSENSSAIVSCMIR